MLSVTEEERVRATGRLGRRTSTNERDSQNRACHGQSHVVTCVTSVRDTHDPPRPALLPSFIRETQFLKSRRLLEGAAASEGGKTVIIDGQNSKWNIVRVRVTSSFPSVFAVLFDDAWAHRRRNW